MRLEHGRWKPLEEDGDVSTICERQEQIPASFLCQFLTQPQQNRSLHWLESVFQASESQQQAAGLHWEIRLTSA
jgi:hypothetical protein